MAIDTITVASAQITDGSVATADIADDAVTSAKLDTNISVDGNLGLGTSVSTRKLNVNAGSYGHMLLDTANAAHGIQILGQANAAANSGFDIQYAASTGMKIRTLAVQPLSLHTSASAGSPAERLKIDTAGHITMPSQSSAQSRPAANITDVTGDATTYYSQQGNGASGTTTYTDIFDQNLDMLNGTFTAPVTGRYLACINVEFDDVASNHSSGVFYIITSNRNYQRLFQPRNMSNVGVNCGVPMTQIVDADANDVIRWALYINGGSKQINITTNTNFGVHLLS